MARMHDNGRGVEQPDLREQIDHVGALLAAVNALEANAGAIADELDGFDHDASVTLRRIVGDARDARFYLGRALTDLRNLI